MNKLLEEYRDHLSTLVFEGHLTEQTSLQAVIDMSDTVSCSVASASSMRCSWLQASSIPKDLQNTVEDLLFEGAKLSSQKTSDTMCMLKVSHVILHLLGFCIPVTKRKLFKPQMRYRSYYQQKPECREINITTNTVNRFHRGRSRCHNCRGLPLND